MPFDFFKKSKPAPKAEELSESLGEALSAEERAYLEEIERRLKPEFDFDNPESVEAELQRRERERLEKTYRPRTPLYHTGNNNNSAGDPKAVKGKPEGPPDKSQQSTYRNDPRYREYFERLKREGLDKRQPTNYDEDVTPTSLDELDRTGWGKSKPTSSSRPSAPPPTSSSSSGYRSGTASVTAPSSSSRPAPMPSASVPPSDDFQAGSLLRFDDGSVAVYKDAVSGKDYALFYFLEPTGRLEPRGIFLEQYEKQKIGKVSTTLLDQMIERKTWDRDAIVFHLDQYEYSSYIPRPNGGNASASSTPPPAASTSGWRSRPQTSSDATPQPVERRPATASDVSMSRPPTASDATSSRSTSRSGFSSSASSSRRDALLERGRVLRINVGGRVWESVYWTDDEIGPIVAHNTNKDWALMHLDLGRFKDSLEYGDVVSYEKLSEIEQSLANQEK